ncbi:MAG: type II toxin-antitoxin system HicB family antitoxin [Pirellulales bacterium]
MATDSHRQRTGSISTLEQLTEWETPEAGTYQLRVLLCPEDGGFIAHALRLPGVVSEGDTEAEAFENVKEAFCGALEEYLHDGGQVPWADVELERTKGSREVWLIVHV